MSEQNKQSYAFDFPPMPALSATESAEVKKERKWPRRLAKSICAVAIGLAVIAPQVHKVDTIVSAERYQQDEVEILLAAGAETLPKGGTEWLVFGGYGQKYSTNAAQELFNALGSKEVVASVKYPNQGFTIDELATYVHAYMKQRGMSKLNVAGVSLGTPTALMTLGYIQEHANNPLAQYQDIAFSPRGLALRKLPEIGYFIAYSSPADVQDASQGYIAQTIVSRIKGTGYAPGMIDKLIVSGFDGEGDGLKSINILNPAEWLKQQHNNLEETFNDTPTLMVLSQMEIAAEFNVDEQWEKWRLVLSPDSYFGYFYPSKADPTVNDAGAYRKYEVALKHLDVPTAYVPTGEPGHANTVATASAASKWIAIDTAALPSIVLKPHVSN